MTLQEAGRYLQMEIKELQVSEENGLLKGTANGHLEYSEQDLQLAVHLHSLQQAGMDMEKKKEKRRRTFMKRILATFMTLSLSLSLAACQSQSEELESTASQPAGTQESEVLTETAEPETQQAESTEENGSSILIAYFTLGHNAEYPDGVDATTSASLVLDGEEMVGTTEYVARMIQENVGGDLHSIETAEPYSTDFDAVVDQNHEEMNAGTLPELVASDLDVSGYDTVFIGYPVWATNAPQAIFSFLSQYDLSGKTVIPFCTHDGYGAGSSYNDIAEAIDGETAVLDGLAIEAPDVPAAGNTVAGWLNEIGVERQTGASASAEETAITITIGDTALEGVLYDTALANEISGYFPLTISMTGFGGREYYGGVDFYPENLEGGQTTFENGDITYCEAHHNMAIFYAQTDDPILSVEVIPVGKVTSDLSVFDTLDSREEITFSLAQ